MSIKIDPILVSVFQRAFKSITDEMSISLTQTTRSPILCEAKDFVTGLYDGHDIGFGNSECRGDVGRRQQLGQTGRNLACARPGSCTEQGPSLLLDHLLGNRQADGHLRRHPS